MHHPKVTDCNMLSSTWLKFGTNWIRYMHEFKIDWLLNRSINVNILEWSHELLKKISIISQYDILPKIMVDTYTLSKSDIIHFSKEII